MKKILILLLLFAILSASAQTDTAEIQIDSVALKTIALPDSTAIGTPDGKSVSKEIGSSGGKIVSDDGRVELNFPEGALSVNTTISIQPTANLAPNGVGKSYWFKPSGIQFKKPVQINFRYTDKEADICPPDWMSLGVQDHKGKWTFIDYEMFDSVSKTLKGFIHHFSGASNINDVRLVPEKYTLRVNKITIIEVIDITTPESGAAYTRSGYLSADIDVNNPVLWYANGVLHGNDHTGKISALELDGGKNKLIIGKYKAPSFMLMENPVTIWTEIYRKTRKGKVLRKRLSTHILIYDEYDVKIEALVDNTHLGPFTQKWTDESSFRLRVGKDPGISNISNNVYKLEKENFTNNKCQFVYRNSATCKGPIHVVGTIGVGLSGGSADTYVTALVEFVKVPWEFPNLMITCPGGSVPTLAFPSFPALPHKMKFQLKTGTFSEEYVGAADFLPGGKVTITIKQVTED